MLPYTHLVMVVVFKGCVLKFVIVLSSGTCSLSTRYLTEFTSNKLSSSSAINFTIDCSNSLSFSSRFSSALPCQSNKCVSLIEVAETPATYVSSLEFKFVAMYVFINTAFY